jgi:hypothetical protein
MDRRLWQRTYFSPRQKGFVNESRCFNNVNALNEILRIAKKKKKKGITLVQLHISKSSHMVPQQIIGPALKRHGIPTEISSSVTNSYETISTIIYGGSSSCVWCWNVSESGCQIVTLGYKRPNNWHNVTLWHYVARLWKKIESNHDTFVERDKNRAGETRRPVKSNSSSDLLESEGSFRTLNFD